MKTKLKLSTLIGIAKEIEREHRTHIRATMNEMWEMLEQAAGKCRTKAEAKAAIEEEVYNIVKED